MDELTLEQKNEVLANYQYMPLLELTKQVFKNNGITQISVEFKSVKKFIASIGSVPSKPDKKEVKKEKFELTDEQKRVIEEMIAKNDTCLNAAKIILNQEKVNTLSKEYRVIYAYWKDKNPDQNDLSDEPVDTKEYCPPNQLIQVISRVNTYVNGSNGKIIYDPNAKLKPSQDKKVRALWSYLKNIRFIYQASIYEKKIDRILFESEFIRHTHDKDDLSQEHVSQYIAYAAEVVEEARTNRIWLLLEKQIEDGLRSDDDIKRSRSEGLAENINAWRQKIDASKKRQEALLDELSESRAEQIKGKENRTPNILNILDAWQAPDTRKQLIELGKKEKREDAEEANKISSLDDLTALFAGISKDELDH